VRGQPISCSASRDFLMIRSSIASLASLALHGKTNSLKGRLLHGTFWVMTGSVFARLSGFVTTIILARFLGKDAFGEYSVVRSTIDMFVVLGAARMGSTATKYIAQYRSTDPQKAERVLAMSMTVSLISCLLMMALLCLLAPWLAAHSLGRPSIAHALAIGAVFMFFTTYATVTEFALSGFEALKTLGMVNILKGLLMPTTAIAFTYKFGLKGLLIALTLNAGLELLVTSWFLRIQSMRHQIRTLFSIRAIQQEGNIFINFALPGILTGLLMASGIWTVNAIFVNQAQGYANLGLFNAANQWKTLILFLPEIISRVILPIMSSTLADIDVSKFNKAAAINLRSNIMIALPLAMAVILFRGQLMQFFGERFRGSDVVLPVLMLSAFACILTNSVNNTLTSAGKRWFTLIGTVVWALLLCGIVGFRIVPLTPMGLGTAYAISYGVYFLFVSTYADIILSCRVVWCHWKLVSVSSAMLLVGSVLPGFAPKPLSTLVCSILLVGSFLPIVRAIASNTQALTTRVEA
jgi:O-antigen/teichoic acid export membrane protein